MSDPMPAWPSRESWPEPSQLRSNGRSCFVAVATESVTLLSASGETSRPGGRAAPSLLTRTENSVVAPSLRSSRNRAAKNAAPRSSYAGIETTEAKSIDEYTARPGIPDRCQQSIADFVERLPETRLPCHVQDAALPQPSDIDSECGADPFGHLARLVQAEEERWFALAGPRKKLQAEERFPRTFGSADSRDASHRVAAAQHFVESRHNSAHSLVRATQRQVRNWNRFQLWKQHDSIVAYSESVGPIKDLRAPEFGDFQRSLVARPHELLAQHQNAVNHGLLGTRAVHGTEAVEEQRAAVGQGRYRLDLANE